MSPSKDISEHQVLNPYNTSCLFNVYRQVCSVKRIGESRGDQQLIDISLHIIAILQEMVDVET